MSADRVERASSFPVEPSQAATPHGEHAFIAEYFDHIYCINLARRADRWEKAQAQFARFGLDVERFEAIDGATLGELPESIHLAQSEQAIPGAVGCLMSHRAVLEDARSRNFERVLILEDDVVFADSLGPAFERFVAQVPTDWAMLYLGGNHAGGFRPVGPNAARTRGTYTTNAYAVTRRTTDILLKLLPQTPLEVSAPVDVVYFDLHSRLASYLVRPHLAWQRNGYSDVELKDVDYTFLRR
jgi:GR25 family glycosyltransferase involved in LPS biosynthesis